MITDANGDPKVMTDWHTAKLGQLFPETIRNGYWRGGADRLFRRTKEALGITDQPKHDPNNPKQSLLLFGQADFHRRQFISLQRTFHQSSNTPQQEKILKEKIRDEAVQALQKLHDTGAVHIQKFYDRNLSHNDRMGAFRRWTRTLDYCMDIYGKLKPITGDDFQELTKKCEDAQVEIRSDAIDELTMSDPEVLQARSNLSQGLISPYDAGLIAANARVRHTAEVMLHSIKTINPNRLDPKAEENRRITGFVGGTETAVGGTIDIQDLQKYSANNTTYNCTRVVPATIGVVFGAKLKAVAAMDDNFQDKSIRSQWRESYETMYNSRFSNVNGLNELFDALEASPPGTAGIIYNQWSGTPDAHVSVVANIAGVACMVEGQTAEMIMRNPGTKSFETHSLGPNGVVVTPFDPNTLTNIQVMIVGPEQTRTEHQRATDVIKKLHEPFFQRESETKLRSTMGGRKKYFVDAPNENEGRIRNPSDMISPPPGPMPYRDPSIPQPPKIGPPPPRQSPPPAAR